MSNLHNIVKFSDRVDIAIEAGESHFREFKSGYEGKPGNKTPRPFKDICADVAKELVAFANADGGELFIGIEDNNKVTGLPHSEEDLQNILDAFHNYIMKETPLAIKRKRIVDYHGKKILYFSVDKGLKYIHQTSQGICYKRNDRDSIPVAIRKIEQPKIELESRQYDRLFEDIARITDLDEKLASEVVYECTKNERISIEKFLQSMDLVEFDGENLRLRKAALLLFAKDINKWHPRSRVRILKVNGTEEKPAPDYNVTEIADISGNVFYLMKNSWEALRPVLSETRFSADGLFKTQVVYPEKACKEALYNAIAHRNYNFEGRGIEIRIFTDRLEILSPGKLLSNLTIEDLQRLEGLHETRNSYIARVLREYGYIRELGEGIRRIYDGMIDNELTPPEIESPNKSFIVRLFNRSIFTPEEKKWLENFTSFKLNKEQRTVVRLGFHKQLLSQKDIRNAVDIQDTDKYRQLIEGLEHVGILKRKVTSSKAQMIAKKKSIAKALVGVFEIVVPIEETINSTGKIYEFHDNDEKKIFVGRLDWNATESDLEKTLSQFGAVTYVTIPKNRETQNSRGFAFVEFAERESVIKALNYKGSLEINGRRLFLQEYMK